MVPNALKRRIIDETSIIEVVSEYIQLEKKGNSMFGLCPFHNDNNPSMSVNDKVKMFNCFSCNTRGNVIDFVAKYNNISEEQAVIILAKRLGIEVDEFQSRKALQNERLMHVMKNATEFYQFYLENSDEGVNALAYLQNRGIGEEIIKEFQIGLAPSERDFLNLALTKKGDNILDQKELGLVKEDENENYYDVFRQRIMFPISDRLGNIVGFSGRIYTESNQAKYINSNENNIFHKSEILYNFYNAVNSIRSLDSVYVFEGFMDVIAAKKAGIDNCVATMGTALTNEHVKLLLSCTKNIILCFDGDSAGIKAMKRSAYIFAKLNIIAQAVVLPDSLDPDEFLTKYGKDKLINYLQTNIKNVYYWLYDLAYQKMLPNDLVSVENLKQDVFEFISISRQESIQSFFLKKLAVDIDVQLDKINEDYANYAKNIPHDFYEAVSLKTPLTVEPLVKPVPAIGKKEVKIAQKVKVAYNSIIKHAVYSKERFAVFYENSLIEGMLRYPGQELVNQYLILIEIQNFYYENDILGIENLYQILALQPDLLGFAKEIIEDRFIDITQKNNFEECLKTIIDFYKKQDQLIIYNQALKEQGVEKIDEYIKMRGNTVCIIRKEKKF